jgi:transcription elongation factor GreA
MSSEKVPMTPEGQARLREELEKLKRTELPQVVKDIATAREHGDLSENAEYHAARERQGMIVARINYIEQSLSRAEVIDPTKIRSNKVQFGARIVVSNVDTGEEVTYQIVGPDEASIEQGRISVASPLAKAMLGHVVGDEIKVRLPIGERIYEILDLSYG